MKKFLSLSLILAVSTCFLSCEREEPNVANLTPSSASIYVGDSTLFTYTGGFSTGSNQWASENPLIASVASGPSTGYNGMVTAHKVGTTTIRANEWVSSKITVLPRYTMITEPHLNWGATKSSIENAMSEYELITSNDTASTYYGKDNVFAYFYFFEDQKLKSCAMIIDINTCDAEDLAKFLNERYYIDYLEDEEKWFLISPDKGTVGNMYPYKKNPTYIIVVYIPYSTSKSSSTEPEETALSTLKMIDINIPIQK